MRGCVSFLARCLPFLLLTACGSDDDAGGGNGSDPDVATELAELGPYPVGFREVEVSYDRPDGEGQRTIDLLVWYPAASVPDDAEPDTIGFAASDATYRDAPPADGPFPVLAFSHGHQGTPAVASRTMEHFASHGWLVASPTHVGNLTTDPDRETWIYYLRSYDVSKSLDALESLPAGDPLAGRFGSPVVMSGHSFGGYTAYSLSGADYDTAGMQAACDAGDGGPECTDLDADALALFDAGFRDERITTVIAMAAGDADLFGSSGIAAVDVPALQMVAEGDGNPAGSAGDDPYWTALSGDSDLRIDVLGGGHSTFTDLCIDLPITGCTLQNDPVEEQVWVRQYALAFARARALGDTRAARFLEQPAVAEQVEITRR